MYDFSYVRPSSIDEAAKILLGDPNARPLSGGQTLIPTLKQRLASPTVLVDLQDISELYGIEVGSTHVAVGAMTRHAEVAAHAGIKNAIPALAFLAGGIADSQVRHMGTMGGSLSNNDPAADYPAAVLGLGAELRTNRRTIAADDFFTGLFSTALEPGELLMQIRFPIPSQAGYCKIPNPASGFVVAGCFIARTGPGRVRVAVNGAGPCVFRQHEFERRLSLEFEPAALVDCTQAPEGLNSDIHASASYRANLVSVAAKRALAFALGILAKA